LGVFQTRDVSRTWHVFRAAYALRAQGYAPAFDNDGLADTGEHKMLHPVPAKQHESPVLVDRRHLDDLDAPSCTAGADPAANPETPRQPDAHGHQRDDSAGRKDHPRVHIDRHWQPRQRAPPPSPWRNPKDPEVVPASTLTLPQRG
jgi:hypothetical protein